MMNPESEEWRRRVSESGVRVVVLRVAFALAQGFSPDGNVTIPKKLLAERSGVSESTVDSAVRELDIAGWLKVERQVDPDTGQDLPITYSYQMPDPSDGLRTEPSETMQSDGVGTADGDLTVDPAEE